MPIDRLRYALEAVAVGLWDWNVRTGDLWWSDNLAAIHGIPSDRFDGTFERFLEFIHPDDRPGFSDVLQRAVRSSDDFTAEFRVVGADTAVRWIRGQGRVFRDHLGEAYRVIGIGFDITDQRAEQSAARQLGVIAMASNDAIVTVDEEGNVTAWNPGAERLFGYSAGEMIGKSIRQIAPPENALEIEQILGRLSLGHGVDNFETERIRKDGSRIFVSISSGPLTDENGRWNGAVTVTRDITLRRREEIRQRLLADASDVLSVSIESDSTLATMAQLIVPRLAERCIVYLCLDDGSLELVTDVSEPSNQQADLSTGKSGTTAVPGLQTDVQAVIDTSKSLLFERNVLVTDNDRPGRILSTNGQEHADSERSSSVLIVPMIARGTSFGAIALVNRAGLRRFDDDDLALALELARRAALAVDNARLFNRVRAAEQQLRLVSDNLPALVAYVGSDYRYHFANRRYDEYVGVPNEVLIGRRLEDVIAHADFEQIRPKLAAALGGEPVRYDVDVMYAKAGKRHVAVEYVPDVGPDGAVRGVVSLIVDVTDRARDQRRASQLYQLTAALAGAVTEMEAATCIGKYGIDALGGNAGAVAVLTSQHASAILRAVRGLPHHIVSGHRIHFDDDTAVGAAIRTGNPVLLRSSSKHLIGFPSQELRGSGLLDGAFAALPLQVDGRTFGALLVLFPEPSDFSQADVDFMMTLANLSAQALDRARAYDAELRARSTAEADRARVAFLAEASRILAGSLDVGVDLKRVMATAVGSLCDWCTIHLFEEDGSIRRLGVVHHDPTMSAVASELERRYAELPATCWRSVRDALNEGRSWFDAAVTEERLRAETKDEGHRELLLKLGFASEMVVPMVAGGRMVGSVTFARGSRSGPFEQDDLSVAEELGRRIALALDNVRLFAGAQSSEARYRTLFEEASEAILIVDPGGNVLGGNSSAARLIGVDRDALIDLSIGSIVAGSPDEPSSGSEQPYLRAGWQGESEAVRADGARIPVELHTTQVDLPSGAAFLVALRDTSERRAFERLQRDFLAMVTHDLRSPLAAIRMHSQLMRRREQFSSASVDAIIGQTDRMAGLINALADVVRTDSGRLSLSRRELDLVELVEQAVSQEQAFDPDRPIEVRAAGPVIGVWDADRLIQVLANLIGNAIKYSPAGSRVIVSVTESDGEAIVTVSDFGTGIATEHQGKLFERFYRADVTGAGGLGLGLYIARMLTEAHGGEIGVESNPGHGSTFTVRLPLVTE